MIYPRSTSSWDINAPWTLLSLPLLRPSGTSPQAGEELGVANALINNC